MGNLNDMSRSTTSQGPPAPAWTLSQLRQLDMHEQRVEYVQNSPSLCWCVCVRVTVGNSCAAQQEVLCWRNAISKYFAYFKVIANGVLCTQWLFCHRADSVRVNLGTLSIVLLKSVRFSGAHIVAGVCWCVCVCVLAVYASRARATHHSHNNQQSTSSPWDVLSNIFEETRFAVTCILDECECDARDNPRKAHDFDLCEGSLRITLCGEK